MRSDHHLNPIFQQVQLFPVESSSSTGQRWHWSSQKQAWQFLFPSTLDTSLRQERWGIPGTSCWKSIQSMQVQLIQRWRLKDTRETRIRTNLLSFYWKSYKSWSFASTAEKRADCTTNSDSDVNNVLNDSFVQFFLWSAPVFGLKDELWDKRIAVVNNSDQESDESDERQWWEIKPPNDDKHKGQNATNDAREKRLFPFQHVIENQQDLAINFQVVFYFVKDFLLKFDENFPIIDFLLLVKKNPHVYLILFHGFKIPKNF